MPDICIWNRCNNNCIMCTNPVGFQSKEGSKDYSFEKITERVQTNIDFYNNIQDNVNFTGGEPTTHPHFLELCYWFRRNFPEKRLVLASNGRMFSYSCFAKSFLKINNLVVETAILGPNKKLHDTITGVEGSFEQTVKGILNILKYRKRFQELELRLILIKQNYRVTEETLNFIVDNFPLVDRVVIIFPEPEGKCGKNYDKVGINYEQVKGKIASVVGKFNDKFKQLRLYHFPLCTLKPELWKYIWITQRRDEVIYLPVCNNCSYKKYCSGIHKDYLSIIGDKEFNPVETGLKFKIEDNPHHPITDIL